MALDKEALYTAIYNDLAGLPKVLDENIYETGISTVPSEPVNQRGAIPEPGFSTTDSAGAKLLFDQIASTIADRVCEHIVDNLQTTEAEEQIIFLKDKVNTLATDLIATQTTITNLNAHVTQLHTLP